MWKLARVVELVKGSNDIVRGARIKFGSSGVVTSRPLNRLYPLELRKPEKKPLKSDAKNEQKNFEDNSKNMPIVESVNEENFKEIAMPKRQAAIKGELNRRSAMKR